MKILTVDDFENVKLVKRIAQLADVEKIELKDFMRIYSWASRRAKREGECTEKKFHNLVVRFVDFMKETFPKKEERDYLFREYVWPEFDEMYKSLQGETLRIKFE